MKTSGSGPFASIPLRISMAGSHLRHHARKRGVTQTQSQNIVVASIIISSLSNHIRKLAMVRNNEPRLSSLRRNGMQVILCNLRSCAPPPPPSRWSGHCRVDDLRAGLPLLPSPVHSWRSSSLRRLSTMRYKNVKHQATELRTANTPNDTQPDKMDKRSTQHLAKTARLGCPSSARNSTQLGRKALHTFRQKRRRLLRR